MGNPGSILDREDPLEKGMATHSGILAWRISRTEEPGRLRGITKSRTALSDFHFNFIRGWFHNGRVE